MSVSGPAAVAVKLPSYGVGQYLVLTFGAGTQVARIEKDTGKRYHIRRLEGRGSKNPVWSEITTPISHQDTRILGVLHPKDHAQFQVIPCPTRDGWLAYLSRNIERINREAAELRAKAETLPDDGAAWGQRGQTLHSAKRREESAARLLKELKLLETV